MEFKRNQPMVFERRVTRECRMQLFALAMVICLSQPIYYKDFSYSNGLVILGKIDGDLEVFNQSGSVKAIIELVK